MMVGGIVHNNDVQMLFNGRISILSFLFSSSKEQYQQQKEKKKIIRITHFHFSWNIGNIYWQMEFPVRS